MSTSRFSSAALVATALLVSGCGREVPGTGQPAASGPAKAAAPAAPAQGRVVKESDVKAEIVPIDIPASMSAGSTATGKVKLTNKGELTWPAEGNPSLKMAYHWYDPEGNKGQWAPVVWDDGNRGSLPKDVAPGESVEVSFPIKALPKPTKNAKLVLVPFLFDVNFCPDSWVVEVQIVK
ncbi:MAG: hypothetical protein JNK60_21400 [Acidobacteria bacterium]|nr:hypothetical protein [Acidobacteriota bacterium]